MALIKGVGLLRSKFKRWTQKLRFMLTKKYLGQYWRSHLTSTENELIVKVDIEDQDLGWQENATTFRSTLLIDFQVNIQSNVKIETGVSVDLISVHFSFWHFSVNLSSLSNLKIDKGT